MSSATVVGAGVFGASVARELALRGWDVTLAEQYAPGTVRSASGGDTRLIRFAHGDAEWYADSAWRSRTLWLELQERTGTRIYEEVGLAWFARRADGFEAASARTSDRLGIPYEWLDPEHARDLYPSLFVDDLDAVLFEPQAGVLRARRATQLLVEDGERLGVRLEGRRVDPGDAQGDVVVWACGPWLGQLFPQLVDVKVSRRDEFFFGVPAEWRGSAGFCEYDASFYGHGDLGGYGMKISSDATGVEIDPDTVDRVPDLAARQLSRDYAARRFPGLADAPVVGARVCQYDLTADTHFLADRHPEHPHWWLLGGGSGHGFKHGPAFGQYVADCIEGVREPEPFHALGARTGDAGLRTASYG